jgi:hypothetical protein
MKPMNDRFSDGTRPRVSAICAAFDGLPHLRARVKSLRTHRLREFEAVSVDDASGDRTSALLAGLHDP